MNQFVAHGRSDWPSTPMGLLCISLQLRYAYGKPDQSLCRESIMYLEVGWIVL